jgi:hypothetical protein
MPPEPGGWHCRRTSTLPGLAIILPQLPKAILALPRMGRRGNPWHEPTRASPSGNATGAGEHQGAVVVAPQALARGSRERKSAGASRKRTVPAEDAEQRARKAERQRRYRERQKAKANGARARAERPGSGDGRQGAVGAPPAADDRRGTQATGPAVVTQAAQDVLGKRACLNAQPLERPSFVRMPDSERSDASLLQPPALPWETGSSPTERR